MLFSVATAAGVLPAALWKEGAEKPGLHYGFRMRSAPALLIGAVVALTLVACVPDDEPVRPDPSPTAEPIFASDEEALAAAEEAYGAYQEVEDEVSAEGGAQPERLEKVSVGDALESAREGMLTYSNLGYRSVGFTAYRLPALQQFESYSPDGIGVVSAYLCLDLGQLDVVDSNGFSVVADTRPNKQAFEITFDLIEHELVLSSRTPWGGGGVCEEG